MFIENCIVFFLERACVALFCLNGHLVRVTIHERSTFGTSPPRSRADSFSNEHMVLADMEQPRCGVGTCNLNNKLFVCGKIESVVVFCFCLSTTASRCGGV